MPPMYTLTVTDTTGRELTSDPEYVNDETQLRKAIAGQPDLLTMDVQGSPTTYYEGHVVSVALNIFEGVDDDE